jgi:hypothetical protein
MQVWNAVQGDTFTYLALAIQHLGEKHGSFPAASLIDSFQPDQQDQREIPPGDFKLVFLSFTLWRLWFGPSSHMPLLSFERLKTGGLGACYCAHGS